MGFLGFLRFAIKYFDTLAWPLLSLGYPLCASIRAIETDSRLLQWFPFWPYMKIMAVCFLMIPIFHGSFYAYKHIIHPCTAGTVPFVIDQFSTRKNLVTQKGDFLAAAERYIAKNGPESLEKLISDQPNPECHAAQNEIKAGNVTQLKESGATQQTQVERMPTDFFLLKNKVNASAESKAGVTPPGNDNIISGIPALKQVQVQKEWACALCQVTTTSEFILKEHYKGRDHKDKQEELKAKKSYQPKARPKISVPGKGSNSNAKIQEEKVKLNGTCASTQKIHPNAEPKNVVPDDAANQKIKTRRRRRRKTQSEWSQCAESE